MGDKHQVQKFSQSDLCLLCGLNDHFPRKPQRMFQTALESLIGVQEPVSRKSREPFGPKNPVVKLQSACFEKVIFQHIFNVRKNMRIAKFDGLERPRCEEIKGILAPEIGPKSFRTFEKLTPGRERKWTRPDYWETAFCH